MPPNSWVAQPNQSYAVYLTLLRLNVFDHLTLDRAYHYYCCCCCCCCASYSSNRAHVVRIYECATILLILILLL